MTTLGSQASVTYIFDDGARFLSGGFKIFDHGTLYTQYVVLNVRSVDNPKKAGGGAIHRFRPPAFIGLNVSVRFFGIYFLSSKLDIITNFGPERKKMQIRLFFYF